MRRISESVRRLEIVLVKYLHYSQNYDDDNNISRREQHRATRHHSKRAKEDKYIKEVEQQKKRNKTAHFDMSWMKQLLDPPYALPKSAVFALERSGCYSKEWLIQQWDEARHQTYAAKEIKVMDKETFWSLPAHEALDLIARTQPYHDTLELIMEHSWFWLFEVVMHAQDVPLPHVVYADFMKCCTFSSLQVPPEYQFALAPSLLRSLLCLSAYYCTIDKYYFTSVHMMYQMMEQQQHSSSELLSSWVYVCTAANKLEIALSYAQEHAERNVEFDKTVFALMQHPSLNPLHITHGGMLNSETELEIREDYSLLHEGFIMQQRLCEQMKQNYGSDSIAVHAMFVYYALTLRHNLKWEVIRLALERHVVLTERTWQLLMSVFVLEKGIRCGAETVKAIVFALVEKIEQDRAQVEFICNSASILKYDDLSSARSSSSLSTSEREMRYISETMYILLRCRRNEHIPVLRHLPSSVPFDEDEVQYIVSSIRGRHTEHELHLPEREHVQRGYEKQRVDKSATEHSTLPLREKDMNTTDERCNQENEHSDLTLVVPVLQELLHPDGDHIGVMKGIAEVVKMLQVKETYKAIPENTNVEIRPIDTSKELEKESRELARTELEYEEKEKEYIQKETHDRSYERHHEEQMSKYSDNVNVHNSNRLKELSHSERVFAALVSTLMEMEQNEGIPTVNCENLEKSHDTNDMRELHLSRSHSHLATQKSVDPLSFSLDRHRTTNDTYDASLQHLVADEQFSALCNYTQQRQQEDEADMKYMRHLPHAWVSPQEIGTEFESSMQSNDDKINNEFLTNINDEDSTAAVKENLDDDDNDESNKVYVQNVVSNHTYYGSDSENCYNSKKGNNEGTNA